MSARKWRRRYPSALAQSVNFPRWSVSAFTVLATDPLVSPPQVEAGLIASAGGLLVTATGGREDVLAQAAEADGLLVTYFELDEPAVAGLARCRVIARCGI